MQPIAWYLARLRGMSAREIAWRVEMLFLEQYEYASLRLGRTLQQSSWERAATAGRREPGFAASPVTRDGADALPERFVPALLAAADAARRHEFTFFDFAAEAFGENIDWHRDYSSARVAPLSPIQRLDYREFDRVGDCKLVWEPNRHHQLVVLARAYRVSGDESYAREVVEQFHAWDAANPFGYGMNWRSPLELAIRLINWIWAFDLIRDSEHLTPETRARWHFLAFLHVRDLARKFSRGSSANNHLIGEAAGVFIATSYFPDWPESNRWRQDAKTILEQQIQAQTFPSGCSREQAFGYQFFVIQFLVLCATVGERRDDPFSPSYLNRLEQMFGFVHAWTRVHANHPPMFGDQDDGYVLDLGNGVYDFDAVLAIGACLFQRSEWLSPGLEPAESCYWLFGTGVTTPAETTADVTPVSSEARLFADCGLAVLRTSAPSGDIVISMDCGELGYGPIAAHGHADALAITLNAGGVPILVDPGTYDYFSFPDWRAYFRGTRAHNTICVDGQEQSELLGPFMWGQHANATLAEWQSRDSDFIVHAEHDGYCRLADPVTHRRRVALNRDTGQIEITDDLIAGDTHAYEFNLHFAPHCRVESDAEIDGAYRVLVGDAMVVRITPLGWQSSKLYHGSETPIRGWMSDGYHRKQPSPTLCLTANGTGPQRFGLLITPGD